MPEEGDAEAAVEAVDGGDPPQQLGADADGHGRPAQRGHRRVRDAEARELRRHHGHVQAVRQLLHQDQLVDGHLRPRVPDAPHHGELDDAPRDETYRFWGRGTSHLPITVACVHSCLKAQATQNKRGNSLNDGPH